MSNAKRGKMPLSSFAISLDGCSGVRGGMGGNCPPLFSKDGPRDSFKIEEKIAGYRFGKIFPRNGRLILRN